MKKKIIAIALCAALAVGGVVAGSLAYLTDKDYVENTFTVGNIDIALDESNSNQDTDNLEKTNSYKMIPGADITKDPTITVYEGSEASWLFVKVEESCGNVGTNVHRQKTADGSFTGGHSVGEVCDFDCFIDYTVSAGTDNAATPDLIEGGWTALPGEDGVYYRAVGAVDADTKYQVLTGDKVTVKSTVTKEMMDKLSAKDAQGNTPALPKLQFTAYAIQKAGFETDPNAAWDALLAQEAANAIA